jgi:hypothetical protein
MLINTAVCGDTALTGSATSQGENSFVVNSPFVIVLLGSTNPRAPLFVPARRR